VPARLHAAVAAGALHLRHRVLDGHHLLHAHLRTCMKNAYSGSRGSI
jgi:hypothetical protein